MKILMIILFLGKSPKEQQFQKVLKEVVTAFSRQDSVALSKYVDKNIGVYLLHRIGVFDSYDHFMQVSFDGKQYPGVLFNQSKNVQLPPLTYARLPFWSCEKNSWSKKGLFADTTRTDHLLSKICRERNKNVPAKPFQFFYELETKSRRIVLYDENGVELVFYLTYLNGNWFLTVVDAVSSDCSV